jgi:hypothetical protein
VMQLTMAKNSGRVQKSNQMNIAGSPHVAAWTDSRLRIFPGRKPTASIILSITAASSRRPEVVHLPRRLERW